MANKKPIVRYFYDGSWKDATVSDIGDLSKLTTAIKTDLVSAINSLGDIGAIPDDIAGLLEDIKNRIDEMESEVGSVKDSVNNGSFNLTQREELENLLKEIDENIKYINDAIDSKIETIKTDYNTKVTEVTESLNEAKEDLADTVEKLEGVRGDLSNIELNVTTVTQEVDAVKGQISQKIDRSDFEMVEAEVRRHTTEINQNAKKIELSATKEELNLATDRISSTESRLDIQADEINSKVSHEEVRQEIDKIDKYQPNLLRNTRDWLDYWVNQDTNNITIKPDTYELRHIVEIKKSDVGLSQEVSGLEVGKTYTVSVYVKAQTGSELWFDDGTTTAQMTYSDGDPTLSNDWTRFRHSFVAENESVLVKFVFKKLVGIGSLSGAKLELGAKTSGWQPHADDIYERTIRNESEIKQNADKITQTVQTVEKQGEDIEINKTAIEQEAGRIDIQVQKIEEIEGSVSENKTNIELLDDAIALKVERTEVNSMIQDINIDGRNRILNSDFARDTEKWSVNNAFSLVEIDEKRMLYAKRSGLTSDLSITATSNAFPIRQGERVMFGFDFKSDIDSYPDKDVVASLEILNISDVRIDFKEISLAETTYINNGEIQRINSVYTSKREDAKKARLVFSLKRNGSVYFGLPMAQFGDVKSTDWSIAPEDTDIRRIQMESELKLTQEEIAMKVSKAEMDELTERVNTNETNIGLTDSKIELSATETKQYADEKSQDALDSAKTYANAQIKIEADGIKQTVTDLREDVSKDISDSETSVKSWAQTQINQSAEEITSTVTSVKEDIEGQIETAKSEIKQTTDGIYQRVEKSEGLYTGSGSLFEQTADGFKFSTKSSTIIGEQIKDEVNPVKDTLSLSIKSNENQFYLSTSTTSLSGGSWENEAPPWTSGYYMWQRAKITLNNGTIHYSPSENGTCIAGASGKDGVAGKDGKGISSTTITYGLSTTDTVEPTKYTSDVPTLVKGRYLWTKTVWKYTDTTTETGYTKTYIAKDGNNGTDGIAGKDGVGISSTKIEYAGSTSGTATPTSGWNPAVPTVAPGNYLWTKTTWTYTDNTTETGYSVAKMGDKGDKGDQGIQGIRGPAGTNGTSQYVYIRYSANSNGSGMTDTPQPNTQYIGLANTTSATAPTVNTSYTWTKAKGETGAQGNQGIQGPAGVNGQTTYTWVKYADTNTGKEMNDSPDGKLYIGLAFNKTTPTESNTASDYTWSLMPQNIEVGGRNLFTNSDYKKNSEGEVIGLSSWGGNKQTGVYDSDVPNGLKGLSEKRICTERGTGGSFHDRDSINFIAGETFTVSFWAKGNNVTHNSYLVCFNRAIDNKYIFGLPSYNLTDKWQKYQCTFTVKDGEEGVYSRRSIIYAESTVWLSHFKLEKGNKATDWTPAPEDIQAELDDKVSNEHVDIIKGDLEKLIGTTEEGIETRVSQKYVETNTFNTISEKVTKMSQSIDGFDFTFDSKSLIDNLNEATGEAEKELQTIRKYIQFTSDGWIILGASDSPSKVEITREKISFKQNDKEVAWFSNQSFNIRSGTILTDLQVGDHKFEKSGTGRTQISYAKR